MNPRHIHLSSLIGRLALFIVYFWFGALKLFDLSPANPMVADLLHATMPFWSFDNFIIWFALFEMLIGLLFLIPRCEKAAFWLFVFHMVTTVMPLFFIPAMTWQGFLTPTLEGQYIIKNVVLVALALFVYSSNEYAPTHKLKGLRD